MIQTQGPQAKSGLLMNYFWSMRQYFIIITTGLHIPQ